MADGLVQVLTFPSWFVKLIGWLGGMRVRLPDKDLSLFQYFWGVALWEREETVDLHLDLAVSLMRWSISVLSAGMAGSAGSCALLESLFEIRVLISGVKEGLKSFLYPEGIEVFAASCRILLNLFTAWAAEVGGGKELNCCSVRSVKEVQSAR